MEPQKQIVTTKKPKNIKKIIGMSLLAILVLVGGIVIYTKQHHRISYLNSKNNGLQANVDTLTAAQAKLKNDNDNLAKSYDTLKSSQKNTPTSTDTKTSVAVVDLTNPTVTTPAAVASLKINSVKVVPDSFFGDTSKYATNTERTINVTMKNLSASTQNYNIGQLVAITDTGEVVQAIIFTIDPGNGTHWNNSDVVAGGTISEYVSYDQSKKIVTLEWTPKGSQPIDLPIPADQS